MIHKPAAEEIVQRQLDAFNARDLAGLVAAYAEDAELFEFPSRLLARGPDQLRERFSPRLAEPHLQAQLRQRIVAGDTVIDHECITRTFPEGAGEIDLVMIYEVRDRRIARAWSIAGEKRVFSR